MNRFTKILAATAVAGVVAVGGSAFTAAGVTSTAGNQFVGGSVSQSVYGAVLTAVDYTVTPDTEIVTAVTLTFSGTVAETTALKSLAAGQITTVTDGVGTEFVCGAAGGGTATTSVALCDTGTRDGLSSIVVTVADGQVA